MMGSESFQWKFLQGDQLVVVQISKIEKVLEDLLMVVLLLKIQEDQVLNQISITKKILPGQ